MKQTVIKVLLFLVALYLIINFFAKPAKLTKMSKGNVEQVIESNTLKQSSSSTNYTYSMWFYVDDWNYKFGQQKVLLSRTDAANQPAPSVTLGSMENDITVSVATYPTTSNGSVGSSDVHDCVIKNYPLQKWVSLIVSVQGQTLDVYIDGKLNKTCVLEGVPKITTDRDVHVTPDGGFSGWTSNFQYWDKSSNPQEAYNIYKKGYGGGLLGNALNKYKLRVQVLKDNDVAGGFEL
tara:strand:- start:379 stop:1083 length:705 start_codon:yes stop_codon:yes gene_type:complete